MLYLECRIPKGATLTLPDAYPEIAAYVVAGDIHIEQESYQSGAMAIAAADQKVSLHASADSHVMVIGGAPLGKRHIWCNFVSSSQQRIEQAKTEWQQQRFDSGPGETEFIPLPG